MKSLAFCNVTAASCVLGWFRFQNSGRIAHRVRASALRIQSKNKYNGDDTKADYTAQTGARRAKADGFVRP